ncbi:Chitin-inducible gibberellin-responsive protein 2 [Platanthera zijinensis]|uniref:Chitin-inducible gibberellin-responsive protein 2 n=1 Tax=Platanthera zijinensis TaxID=2320716 RepID=A0AAP0B9E5_9ASPA
MTELRHMVSVSGEPLQRLGAYMLEGLVARLSSSGSVIYKSLKCSDPLPPSSDLLSHMHILYEVCPYFKFGYISANGAIAEAVKHEDMIHIIDFQIAQGSQWLTLIQALALGLGRPAAPENHRDRRLRFVIRQRGWPAYIVGQSGYRVLRGRASCLLNSTTRSSPAARLSRRALISGRGRPWR